MASCTTCPILVCNLVLFISTQGLATESTLPVGRTPEPAMFAHFPDRMHAVVWRNWNAVETVRIAKVLGTSVRNVTAVAESMGLPPAVPISPEQNSPGFFHERAHDNRWEIGDF